MNVFENYLKEKKVDYVIEDGTIVVTDKNKHVFCYDLTKIGSNIRFNNWGNIYFEELQSIGDNIQFNNQGYVSLRNLKTMGDNIQFNNGRYVNISKFNKMGDNVQFNNDGLIFLGDLFGKCHLQNIPNRLSRF